MHRLLDCPPIADLEAQIVRDKPWNIHRMDYPFDQVSLDVFGLTRAQAEHLLFTASEHDDADGDAFYSDPRWGVALETLEVQTDQAMAAAILSLGWDVNDASGRPMHCLSFFAPQLVLAALDLVGKLPDADADERAADAWGESLAAEAAKFRRTSPHQRTATELLRHG